MKTIPWASFEEIYRVCDRYPENLCPVCLRVDKSLEGLLCAKHLPEWEAWELRGQDSRDNYLSYVNLCIDKQTGMCYRALRNWLEPRKTFSRNP